MIQISIHPTPIALGAAAAAQAAQTLRQALAAQGQARLVLATGASQFETLRFLVQAPDIDWAKVTGFHLDEYLGLPTSHPASFRRYLQERFASQVLIGAFHFVDGEAEDPQAECQRLGALIQEAPIDLALIGIGENGHLAFNDPPADFVTEESYIVVNLDEVCRKQQVGEGWFTSLDEVPLQAISMSIPQILQARQIICSVPDRRKAQAVKGCLEGPITPNCPASALQEHPDCTLYLDLPAASLITGALETTTTTSGAFATHQTTLDVSQTHPTPGALRTHPTTTTTS